MKQKKHHKPLLVLGAVATLGGQLSADLSLIAYAATTAQASELLAQQTTQTELAAVQQTHTRYDLMNVTTQTLPDVTLQTGLPGDTLIKSFTFETSGSSTLQFKLGLAGPSDSRVTIKINGKTYFNQMVGIGKLDEVSFFSLPNTETIQVEIEYHVGNEPVVLSGNPYFELNQLVVTSQEVPTRPLEYRVKGTSEWQSYSTETGIETTIRDQKDTMNLELRYTDQSDLAEADFFDLTINAPEAVAPLLVLETDGRFYLNHFSSLHNAYAEVAVRFNHGQWQPYEAGMVLPFESNICDVDVRVINDFGVETLLPTQRYELPTLNAPQISEHPDGTLSLSHNNVAILDGTLEYQWNDGEWTTYEEALTPSFEAGVATLNARVVDRYGRESLVETHTIQAPQPDGGKIIFNQGLIQIETFQSESLSHVKAATQTYYRVNGGEWTLYQKPFYLKSSDWAKNGVIVEAKGINDFGAESDLIALNLSEDEQQQIKPSVTNVSYQGTLETHSPITFSAFVETNGGTNITLMEWSLDRDEWTPFKTLFELTLEEAGEHTLYLRATNANDLTSEVYSKTLNVAEATPPRVSNLRFEETDLYVGANFSPIYDVELKEGGEIVQCIWGGDIDTMFDTPGEKTITLKVQDDRRLWSEEISYTFNVRALKAPVITGVQPSKEVFYEGDTISFDFLVDYDTQAAYQKVEWLAGHPFASHVGTHQVVFRVQDTQGQWSEPYTYTYQVKARIVEPTLTFKNAVLKVPYGSKLTAIYKQEAIFTTGTSTEAKYGAYIDTFDPYKVGKQTVKYLIKYTQDGVEHRKYVYRTIEVLAKDPVLSFKQSVLKVPYGSKLTSIYKTDVVLDKGSATDVKYGAYTSTYNPNKVGKQQVKYLVTYKQNGVEERQYVYRTIEVLAKEPKLSFKNAVLKVPYGSKLTSIYKKDVVLDKGSATNVKYAAYTNTFDPKKVGKQTVKYLMTYTQNGVSKRQYVYRTIEVTAVKPTLTFSKTTLTAKYGQTPNFNTGVTLNKGSATNVKYAVVKGTYNPKKRGKQTVSYQLSYTQNGKTYKTIVKRTVMVK